MPKSKQRKGHKKRIAARNQNAKAAQNKMQKLFNDAIQKQMEEMKASGNTENLEFEEVQEQSTTQEIVVTEQ